MFTSYNVAIVFLAPHVLLLFCSREVLWKKSGNIKNSENIGGTRNRAIANGYYIVATAENSRLNFTCSKSTTEIQKNMWNVFIVSNKDTEQILIIVPVFSLLTLTFSLSVSNLNTSRAGKYWEKG